jgi:phosphatidylglycerol:prolipoprotein diacylglycerol transferase
MLPILYQSDSFILYSYPLMMGLGWGIAYQIFFALIPPELGRSRAQLLFWGIFLSAWLGAKALFLLTIPSEISQTLLREASFWTGGGFVFFGGLLAGVAFVLLYRLSGLYLSPGVLWAMLPALVFGHALGRVGCFLAGCCFGKVTDWWWAVPMAGEHRHPTQLIEALGLFILGAYLLRSKRGKLWLLGCYFLSYGLLRFGVETLRGDLIRGSWGQLTPSQWISLGLMASGAIFLFKFRGLDAAEQKRSSI